MSDQPRLHPSVAAVADALHARGARGSVRVLPDEARTAAQAADALGCDVGAIANSLVFDADGGPLLILTSGAHRVDVPLVAASLGIGRLGRATPEFVRLHTGQVIGGVAPLGHPAPVRTCIDVALRAHPVVWAAAGHAHAVFDTTFDELASITGATPIAVAPDEPPRTSERAPDQPPDQPPDQAPDRAPDRAPDQPPDRAPGTGGTRATDSG